MPADRLRTLGVVAELFSPGAAPFCLYGSAERSLLCGAWPQGEGMPVTAKLSRAFYERLGDEIANELVNWLAMDVH